MCDIRNYIGFHGTSKDDAESILKNGFDIVESDTLLLGSGAYFFVEGLSNPSEDALDFVTNVEIKLNPVVIMADISAQEEQILDLSTINGAAIFNKYKERFFKKRIEKNEKMSKKLIDDGKIINYLIGETFKDIKIVISSRVLQLKKDWKELNLHSQIPNCVFCCVKDKNCISNVREA